MAKQIRTSKKTIADEYFTWICDVIKVNMPDHSYFFLAQELRKTEFVWSVANDDNRADDGKQLRYRFLDEYEFEKLNPEAIAYPEFMDKPCSVLEMLLALAQRMNLIMDELDNCDKTVKWFWELVRNLRLDMFDDESYFDNGGTPVVKSILDDFLQRRYRKNGKGGLFPLKKTKKDQRKVEIWYQMSEYLMENYYDVSVMG